MSAGPPRPRPWPAGDAKTVGEDDVERLTAPWAFQIRAGVVGYHAPKKLAEAAQLLAGLRYWR